MNLYESNLRSDKMWTFWIVAQIVFIAAMGRGITMELDTEVQDFRREFGRLLRRVYSERPYQSVLLQQRLLPDCVDADLRKLLTMPLLSWTIFDTFYWKGNYNSDILAIMCLTSPTNHNSLKKLATNLQHMRDTRIMVILNEDYSQSSMWQVEEFFLLCKKLKMLNINTFYRNFHRLGIYHSYTQFPTFQLENRSLHSQVPIFPDRLSNMHGKVVLTVTDQIMPYAMLYKDASGKVQAGGYIEKFMRVFAEKYNCTLRAPINLTIDDVIYVADIRAAARNGTIDIGTSISTPQRELNIHEYSYPAEISNWRTMVPIEQPVPTSRLLLNVLDTQFQLLMLLLCFIFSLLLAVCKAMASANIRSITLSDVFCNHASIRGILGQSFNMNAQTKVIEKFVYLLIFFTGLLFVTCYVGNLSNLLTTPPRQPPINTFDDAVKRNFKILISEDEVPGMNLWAGREFWKKYKSIFVVTKTYTEFAKTRTALDTRYGYTIVGSIWTLFDEQQRHFARRLFRLSNDLSYCFFMLLGFPVNENSFYKEPLNRMVMQTRDTGLYAGWIASSFYEFVLARKISFTDFSTARTYTPLRVEDFTWLWLAYCIAMFFCMLTFAAEIMCFRYKSKRREKLRPKEPSSCMEINQQTPL